MTQSLIEFFELKPFCGELCLFIIKDEEGCRKFCDEHEKALKVIEAIVKSNESVSLIYGDDDPMYMTAFMTFGVAKLMAKACRIID